MSNRYSNLAQNALAKVKASYNSELLKYANMSFEDFSQLIPHTSDKETVKKLKAVIDDAAARNLTQADLLNNIKKLGNATHTLVKTVFPAFL